MQPVGVMRGPPFGEWCDLVYRLFSCCPMNAWWWKTCWPSEVRVDCSIDDAAVKNSYNRFWIWLCALLYQSARASRIIFFFRALHMAACMEIFLEGCSLPLSMVSACCLNPLLKKIISRSIFPNCLFGSQYSPVIFFQNKRPNLISKNATCISWEFYPSNKWQPTFHMCWSSPLSKLPNFSHELLVRSHNSSPNPTLKDFHMRPNISPNSHSTCSHIDHEFFLKKFQAIKRYTPMDFPWRNHPLKHCLVGHMDSLLSI